MPVVPVLPRSPRHALRATLRQPRAAHATATLAARTGAALLLAALALPDAQAQECSLAQVSNDGYPAGTLITLDSDANAFATFCGGSAGYTSEAWLGSGTVPTLIGVGHQTADGTVVDLGSFTEGTELVFFIYVRNTGDTFYSGPASRNPDGQVHAAIEAIGDGVFRVGFEDLYGGGDRDYDDINLIVNAEAYVAPDPTLDSDGDGLPDAEDLCPRDAFPESPDGCEQDTDGDGVGDSADRCPGEDDTVDADGNGRADCVEALGVYERTFTGTVAGGCYDYAEGPVAQYAGEPLRMTVSVPVGSPSYSTYDEVGPDYHYGVDEYLTDIAAMIEVAGTTTLIESASSYTYMFLQDSGSTASHSDYFLLNTSNGDAYLYTYAYYGDFVVSGRRLSEVTDGWVHSYFRLVTYTANGYCDWNGTLDGVEETAVDTDGDGVSDDADACPAESAAGWDTDGDGCLDDSDADGITDDVDVCPEGSDLIDDDDDGAADACDICPGDALNDQDGDTLCTAEDLCPNDYGDGAGSDDLDGDSVCNSEDVCAGDDLVDRDGDQLADDCDLCPLDADNDADDDSVCGDEDICLGDDTVDSDSDGLPDDCDTLCPLDPTNDADFDGVCGESDPCPLDALDDSDGDGSCDRDDICPGLDDFEDTDGDAQVDCRDTCPLDVENDGDGDGLCESDDNCEGVSNPDQSDVDQDGIGNACEPDSDADGVVDDDDNCRLVANASQADGDADGIGDACDADLDNDGASNGSDTCAGTPAGTPVLVNGCSVGQTCSTTASWKNHGAYVSCVTHAANDLARAGVITQAQKDAYVTAAAQSNVGKR